MIRRLWFMLFPPRCCECKRKLDTIVWKRQNGKDDYVCRDCAARLGYNDYMPTIQEWLYP